MVSKVYGAKECSGGEISTGMYRISHNLNHDRYNVFLQTRQAGVYAVLTGVYATYFTFEIRTFAGVLTSANYSFVMIGDN